MVPVCLQDAAMHMLLFTKRPLTCIHARRYLPTCISMRSAVTMVYRIATFLCLRQVWLLRHVPAAYPRPSRGRPLRKHSWHNHSCMLYHTPCTINASTSLHSAGVYLSSWKSVQAHEPNHGNERTKEVACSTHNQFIGIATSQQHLPSDCISHRNQPALLILCAHSSSN
jgi:hypothetical protein